jgi:hypothetical protein
MSAAAGRAGPERSLTLSDSVISTLSTGVDRTRCAFTPADVMGQMALASPMPVGHPGDEHGEEGP